MFARFLPACAAAAFIFTVGPAAAGTLSYSSFSVIAAQTVTLSGSVVGRQETAAAGQIQLNGINGGPGSLLSYCIDVPDRLLSSGSFGTGTTLSGKFADTFNALVTHVTPNFATDANASAALQVAIWKAEYGTALTVSGNTAVTNLAASYLAKIDSGTWVADRNLFVSVLDGGGQNQTQAFLARVPEPATVLLVGIAVLGMGALRLRRASARP